VLLDENVPHGVRGLIAGQDVSTIAYMSWQGLENGALLSRAAEGFDVLVSIDAGIGYEQNLRDIPLSVVLVREPSNTLDDIRPLISAILEAIESMGEKELVRVGEV
jgi:hypothetical protein